VFAFNGILSYHIYRDKGELSFFMILTLAGERGFEP